MHMSFCWFYRAAAQMLAEKGDMTSTFLKEIKTKLCSIIQHLFISSLFIYEGLDGGGGGGLELAHYSLSLKFLLIL